MQPSDAPVLLYLWDKRTFYLSAFAEPLQLSQAAAMLLVGLDDELLIHSQGAALRCRSVSGCDALMLGRGIVADPGLALSIRAHDRGAPALGLPWEDLLPHMARFWHLVCEDLEPRQRAGRLKQWLNLLRRRYPQAQAAFDEVRVMTDQQAITAWVARVCAGASVTAGGRAPAAPAA